MCHVLEQLEHCFEESKQCSCSWTEDRVIGMDTRNETREYEKLHQSTLQLYSHTVASQIALPPQESGTSRGLVKVTIFLVAIIQQTNRSCLAISRDQVFGYRSYALIVWVGFAVEAVPHILQ